MKSRLALVAVTLLVLGLVGEVFSGNRSNDLIGVAVSPQALLLSTPQGEYVTVHTTIPLSQVDRGSLTLNGIPVAWTKADNQGNLVAEFDEPAIKAIVAPPSALMTLKGATVDGLDFAGSDTVQVRE